MVKKVSGIVLAAVFAFAASAFAHEHKVMGTATMVGPDHVMMKTTDGHDVTVNVTKNTKITKGKETVKLATIKEGTRLVVTTASDEAPYAAMAIQVGATTPAKTTTKK